MAIDILVPTLRESVNEATLAKWFKAVGDTVAADEPLAELETDKVSLEVNAPAAGVLMEIRVPEGADVGLGAVLGVLKEGTAVSATVPAPTPATELVPAPVPQPVGNDTVDIVVPTLGESITEATVAKWFKTVGDAVGADEPLVELETDKVSVEVNAPTAGKLASIAAAAGTEVSIGALLGTLQAGAGAPATAPTPAAPPPATPPSTNIGCRRRTGVFIRAHVTSGTQADRRQRSGPDEDRRHGQGWTIDQRRRHGRYQSRDGEGLAFRPCRRDRGIGATPTRDRITAAHR